MEMALEAIERKQFLKFRKIFKTYEKLQANIIIDILADTVDVLFNRFSRNKIILNPPKRMTKADEKKIKKRINKQLKGTGRLHSEFMLKVEKAMPQNLLYNYFLVFS